MSDRRSGDIASITAMNQFGIKPRSRTGGDKDVPSLLPSSGGDYDLSSEQKAPPPSTATTQQKAEAQDRIRGEQSAQRYQDQQRSLFRKQASKAGSTAKAALGSVQNGLEGLSMPGGLAVPLFVLVILLMALVKNNGHTRLEWLWLVLTGNAALPNVVEGSGDFGPGSGSGGSGGSGNGGGSGGFTSPPPPSTPLQPVYLTNYAPLELGEL